jgi:hypothetical protein
VRRKPRFVERTLRVSVFFLVLGTAERNAIFGRFLFFVGARFVFACLSKIDDVSHHVAPRFRRSTIQTLIALDKLPVRDASISATSCAIERPSSVAARFSSSQKTGSRLIEVW